MLLTDPQVGIWEFPKLRGFAIDRTRTSTKQDSQFKETAIYCYPYKAQVSAKIMIDASALRGLPYVLQSYILDPRSRYSKWHHFPKRAKKQLFCILWAQTLGSTGGPS